MLDSLYIKNYRNLKELKIKSLGRVNLITGKNNTGKSSVLEAIGIYATKGDIDFIYQILNERGEIYKKGDNNNDFLETNLKTLSSIFTKRKISFEYPDSISIGTVENTLFGEEVSNKKSIRIRFIKYFDETVYGENELVASRKRTIVDDNLSKSILDYKTGIEFKVPESSLVLPLEIERPYNRVLKGINNTEILQYIKTRNIDSNLNGSLWDNIALSEKEQFVIEALRIIEPDVERVTFIGESSQARERSVIIKLKNNPTVFPLRSMGDGINRILTIILALVNADNGYLLIDEFENGLHYSVQEKLWEIIFSLAQRLNIQVFVTTHSNDSIIGFESILNSPVNQLEGKLIRLDNLNGEIKQVEFDKNELRIATEQDIETR